MQIRIVPQQQNFRKITKMLNELRTNTLNIFGSLNLHLVIGSTPLMLRLSRKAKVHPAKALLEENKEQQGR